MARIILGVWFIVVSLIPAAAPAQPVGGDAVEQHIERGNRHLRAGEYGEALREWEMGLRKDPSNSMLHTLIAITKVQIRPEKKRQIALGTRHFFTKPGKACKAWLRVMQMDPDDAEARRNVELLQEEIEKRVSDLTSAAEQHIRRSEFIDARDLAVEIMELECDSNNSQLLMEKIRNGYVGHLKDKLGAAQRDYHAGKSVSAVEILEDLTGEDLLSGSDTATVYLFLGYAYAALREDERALASFKSAISFNPTITVRADAPARVHRIFREARAPEPE